MGTTLLTVMEPGCFTAVKKLGTQGKAALGKEMGKVITPVVPITQLGLELCLCGGTLLLPA